VREFTHCAPFVTQGSVNPLHVQLRSQTPQAPVPPPDEEVEDVDDVLDPELEEELDVEPDAPALPLVDPDEEVDEEVDEVEPEEVEPEELDPLEVTDPDAPPLPCSSGRSNPLLPGNGMDAELSSPALPEGVSEPAVPVAHAVTSITQGMRSRMVPCTWITCEVFPALSLQKLISMAAADLLYGP
jgi:hypothetical protein